MYVTTDDMRAYDVLSVKKKKNTTEPDHDKGDILWSFHRKADKDIYSFSADMYFFHALKSEWMAELIERLQRSRGHVSARMCYSRV